MMDCLTVHESERGRFRSTTRASEHGTHSCGHINQLVSTPNLPQLFPPLSSIRLDFRGSSFDLMFNFLVPATITNIHVYTTARSTSTPSIRHVSQQDRTRHADGRRDRPYPARHPRSTTLETPLCARPDGLANRDRRQPAPTTTSTRPRCQWGDQDEASVQRPRWDGSLETETRGSLS